MNSYFEINNLKINFKTFEGKKNILDIEHLEIPKGTTYGLVGESGSGKTVLALSILKLLAIPPGEIERGEIILDGEDILKKSKKEMKSIRGKKIAMIFQDPLSTLNPVYTVGYQIIRVIMKNQGLDRKKAYEKALETVGVVNLPDAENVMGKYPHQLSGGQRQRIVIAMALSCGAEFFIADEPTRNLDVTIQAGILKLIKKMQREYKITVLFIANNLGLVRVACDTIGILHNGIIIETGDAGEIITNPKTDYTKMLISAVTKGNKGKAGKGGQTYE